jgi:hypothetical protein
MAHKGLSRVYLFLARADAKAKDLGSWQEFFFGEQSPADG